MYFDRISNQKGFRASILLVSPYGVHASMSIKLDFDVTNNIAEYDACIIGLQATIQMGVKNIRVYGDYNS